MKLTPLLRRGLKFETPWWRPKGIIIFSVSPFEQSPFQFKSQFNRISNLSRRIQDKAFIFFPPFVVGYAFLQWMENENAKMSRKQPCQFIYPEDREDYVGEKEEADDEEEEGDDNEEGEKVPGLNEQIAPDSLLVYLVKLFRDTFSWK